MRAATWARILTEFKASGLVAALRDAGASVLSDLDKVLEELVVINPAQLELAAPDLHIAEDFDTPGAPAIAAAPAVWRGRRIVRPAVAAVAATNPVSGPHNLQFLAFEL